MGARIVLASWGSYGDLFPYLGLALALKRRGHAPVLATCAYYRDIVEGRGIEFAAIPPDIDPNDRAFIARAMDPWRGVEAILGDMILPHLRESHRALDAACAGADLVVTHPITFTARMVAEQRGLPWISTVLAPLSLFSVHDLPVHPGFWPSRHANALPLAVRRLLGRFADAVSNRMAAPVHALRTELGLPPTGNPMLSGQYSPLATLALFPSVLGEPQPDWPQGIRRCGFVRYNGPDPMPPALDAFLEAGPPPITFTLGTAAIGVAGSFFQESALAAASLGQRAVLLVGRHADNRPEHLPDGVIAVEYAPHSALFPRSSVNVHQCGVGTLSQALLAGKPQLAVPFANDQPDNAHRVNRLGVARVCLPRRYRSGTAAEALQALLSEARYRQRAAELGAVVGREDGAEAASDAIEDVLRP